MAVIEHEARTQEVAPQPGLGWQEKLVIRILLLVARFVAVGLTLEEDKPLAQEIRNLSNHIEVHR